MAAHTETLRFGTFTYNIGLRHPFLTARSITTLDHVSGGRVELGIGASWLREEWQAMELDFDSRGRRVNEAIEVVQRLFTDDEVEHEGEFFRFQPVGFLPKPIQAPWPRMHIGGDSPAALRRAAELGDGWIPHMQTLETLPRNLARLQAMRADLGRQGPFQVTVMPSDVTSIDDVCRYEDVGVDRLIVTPFSNPKETVAGLQRFGDTIIAALT